MIWTMIGLSVAIVALFCVGMAELALGRPFFEEHRIHLALGLAGLGGGIWLTSVILAKRRQENGTEDDAKSFLLFELRYWGPMLILLGAITFFIHTIAHRMEAIIAARVNGMKKTADVEVPPPPPSSKTNTPVTFPTLKVQGLIFRQDRPVVIFNGRPYGVGERMGDVTVKAITRESVTVEKSNEIRVISLAGITAPTPSGVSLTPAEK